MSNIITTSLTQPLTNTTVFEEPFIYKGLYLIELDLGPISEKPSRALTVTIDWGDDTENEIHKRSIVFDYRKSSIFDEVLYGRLGGSVLGRFEHRYTPSETHIRAVSAQVVITFDNGSYTKIVQPISLVMESYYDYIKEFSINSMVIHDTTQFSILNLQSKYNERTWPALWADNRILDTSVFPPPRDPDGPDDPRPEDSCPYFNCTGNEDHPVVDCPPGYKFNCTTCRCERELPPVYPPCNTYPSYPNNPNYPLCYNIYTIDSNFDSDLVVDPTFFEDANAKLADDPRFFDPFGFNFNPINPDT